MNNQEAFIIVAKHLLSMDAPSRKNGIGCAYRGENGAKCAVGCLIPDDLYEEKFEGCGVSHLFTIERYRQHFVNVDEKMLACLQNLHDANYFDNKQHLALKLGYIAKMFNINYLEDIFDVTV